VVVVVLCLLMVNVVFGTPAAAQSAPGDPIC
jgi:hypothetical protein